MVLFDHLLSSLWNVHHSHAAADHSHAHASSSHHHWTSFEEPFDTMYGTPGAVQSSVKSQAIASGAINADPPPKPPAPTGTQGTDAPYMLPKQVPGGPPVYHQQISRNQYLNDPMPKAVSPYEHNYNEYGDFPDLPKFEQMKSSTDIESMKHRTFLVEGSAARASNSFGDRNDNLAPTMREAINSIYGPPAALNGGFGYWVSDRAPNAEHAVTYTVDLKDRFPVSGLVVDWAYAPKQVRLLCTPDGQHHWHEMNAWHINPTGYGWESYQETFRFPTQNVRACQLQMMGKQPWEFTGISHLAFIHGNPVETVPQTPDASMAPHINDPEPNLPDPLNDPIPIAQPDFFKGAFPNGSHPMPGEITATRDPTTGIVQANPAEVPSSTQKDYGQSSISTPAVVNPNAQM